MLSVDILQGKLFEMNLRSFVAVVIKTSVTYNSNERCMFDLITHPIIMNEFI